MSGHRIPFDLFLAQNKAIPDPGNAGTIRVNLDLGHVPLISGASAETRTLLAPGQPNLRCLVYLRTDGGGDITLTATGSKSVVFSAAGDAAMFISVEEGAGTYVWRLEGSPAVPQLAPATATDTATLTAAQLLTGIIVSTPTAAATYTLPTGTLFEAAFGTMATNTAFDFSIINVATNATFIITVAVGTGWTLSGSMRVDANAGTAQGQGRFRARRTAANTFTLYRIA